MVKVVDAGRHPDYNESEEQKQSDLKVCERGGVLFASSDVGGMLGWVEDWDPWGWKGCKVA